MVTNHIAGQARWKTAHLRNGELREEKEFFSRLIPLGGFPGGSDGKESACNAGDPGSIPGWEIYPGERNGNPFQYSCLENSMDRGAWQPTVHGMEKSQTQPSDTQGQPLSTLNQTSSSLVTCLRFHSEIHRQNNSHLKCLCF